MHAMINTHLLSYLLLDTIDVTNIVTNINDEFIVIYYLFNIDSEVVVLLLRCPRQQVVVCVEQGHCVVLKRDEEVWHELGEIGGSEGVVT